MTKNLGSKPTREATTTVDPARTYAPLTPDEAQTLARCEAAIEAAIAQVGAALQFIRDQRLYRATHATFEAYLAERWGRSRTWATRQIAAAVFAADNPEAGADEVRAVASGKAAPNSPAGVAGMLATAGKPRAQTNHYHNLRTGAIKLLSFERWNETDADGTPCFLAHHKAEITERIVASVAYWPPTVRAAVMAALRTQRSMEALASSTPIEIDDDA